IAACSGCEEEQLRSFARKVHHVVCAHNTMLAELVRFDPRPSVRRIGHHTEFPAAGQQRLDAYAPVGLQRAEASESIRRGSVGSMRAAAIRNSAANWSASRSCRTSPGWGFRCKIKCPSRYETIAHPGAIMYALRDRGHEPTPSPPRTGVRTWVQPITRGGPI